jgi:hypothetical protein
MVKCVKCKTEYDPLFIQKCPNPKCKQTIFSWINDVVGDISETTNQGIKIVGDLIDI